MNGGFLATGAAMSITYVSGALLDLSGRLGEAWAHLTPGQAALLIGVLTVCAQHGKAPAARLAAAAAGAAAGLVRRRKRRAAARGNDMRALVWLTAASVAAFLLLVLLAAAVFIPR